MRRQDNYSVPIGVIPLGQFNQFSLSLLNSRAENNVEVVRAMAASTLAIVKGSTRKKDVMKIELVSDDEEEAKRTFYSLGSISWGSFTDILKKKDKYWLTGSLRNYSAFLFNGLFARDGITWNCSAQLTYSEPCQGCSNCYEKIETKSQKLQNSRWWSKFNSKDVVPEYSKILNPNCLQSTEIDIKSSEFAITSNSVESQSDDESQLNVKFNEEADNYSFNYIWQSWKRVSDRNYLNIPDAKVLAARQVTLFPQLSEDKESFFSIDNNSFEVRPIKVTVLPKRIEFFVN